MRRKGRGEGGRLVTADDDGKEEEEGNEKKGTKSRRKGRHDRNPETRK